MPEFTRRHIMVLGSGLLVSACALPRGAARESEILRSATRKEMAGDYAIYEVTRAFLPKLAHWPMTGSGPRGGWISRGPSGGPPKIARGDRLDLVIWDNESNSLLATAGQKAVTLTGLLVDPEGGIFVPYLNHVAVAGMTAEQARADIQQRMAALTPSAQVQITLVPGRHNSVELVGGVGRPGTFPLVDGGISLLTLISQAGGVAGGLKNPIVRLSRNGRIYVTTIARLYANPSFDTILRGGDKVIIETDPRNFIALGASRSETLVQFPKDNVTALDALAEIGGVNPGRANPKGILILRQYATSQVSKTGRGPEAAQAIFIIDMTTADGLFAAGKFVIHPDDLVYVSESALNTANTISGVVGSLLSLGQRTQNLTGL